MIHDNFDAKDTLVWNTCTTEAKRIILEATGKPPESRLLQIVAQAVLAGQRMAYEDIACRGKYLTSGTLL